MCGRYAATRSSGRLIEEFEVQERYADPTPDPDYNVAPTKTSAAILTRKPKGADEKADPVRQLRTLRWGLVPSWAKDPKIGARMINARAETVHEKPAYRRAFASRRCLIPIDGFYEWFPTQQLGKSGKPLKQPFYLHPTDDTVLPLAGLYEFWRNPEPPSDDPEQAWWVTFTIITTNATDDVGHIHDRMPMTIPPQSWADWLDSTNDDPAAIRDLMQPPEPGSLETYPVSKAVNNVRNNGSQLLEPIPADQG
jgi:putative SOS response-associated peptidase YedK